MILEDKVQIRQLVNYKILNDEELIGFTGDSQCPVPGTEDYYLGYWSFLEVDEPYDNDDVECLDDEEEFGDSEPYTLDSWIPISWLFENVEYPWEIWNDNGHPCLVILNYSKEMNDYE